MHDRNILKEFSDSTWAQDCRLAIAEFDGLMEQLGFEISRLDQLLPLLILETRHLLCNGQFEMQANLRRNKNLY